MKNGIKTFICEGCGNTITKSCAKKQRFCSVECYRKSRTVYKPRMGVTKTCVVCGNSFYVPQNRAKKATTCSLKCTHEYQRRNKITIVCYQCGKEKTLSPFFKDQRFCSVKCYNASDEFKKMLTENNAKNNRNHMNNFEKMAYALMNEMGISFISQYIISDKFTVDAFIPSKNIVVQFDGDYWHGNKEKYKTPDYRQKKRMDLDISQDAYMKACGIEVIRVWQSEFKNIESVKSKLSVLLD